MDRRLTYGVPIIIVGATIIAFTIPMPYATAVSGIWGGILMFWLLRNFNKDGSMKRDV